MKIFRPPNSKFSFDRWLSKDELLSVDIEIVSDIDSADVIAASLFSELLSFIEIYGARYKYFIWCPEPIWQLTESFNYVDLSKHCADKYGVDLRVLSYLDESSKTFSTLFLAPWYLGDGSGPVFEDRLNRAIFMGIYRSDDQYLINCQPGMHSLNDLRSKVALDMYKYNYMDIFGKNWPDGVSVADSRDGDWIVEKLNAIKKYRFCLSFENCAVRNYVSEKIWQPISVGTLPIYLGHGESSIYDFFPRNSFIDFSDFSSVESLVDYLNSMSKSEYIDRIHACVNVLLNSTNNKSLYSDSKKALLDDIVLCLG